mgnify:CR=1 FL=1
MGLSILDVKVSQNMHNATVFVNLSGDALKKLKELNEYADVIKASIYKKVQLRYVPKILFRLDKDFEKSIKVHEILKSESDNISD